MELFYIILMKLCFISLPKFHYAILQVFCYVTFLELDYINGITLH